VHRLDAPSANLILAPGAPQTRKCEPWALPSHSS
jgi:hypothetical protein